MPRNRQIFIGRSIREWSGGELTFRKPQINLDKLVSARLNKGVITSIDSADIPLEALQFGKDIKVSFDKTLRRDGLALFGPSAPSAFPVLKMASIKQPDGSGHTYRFTESTIHDLQAGVWNAITETVALAGTANDRFNIAVILEFFVFTNNGANNVQWIDSVTDVSDDLIDNLSGSLGDSKFRYCTGFFERAVFGALREENEALLAWSGQYGSKGTAKKGLEDLDPVVNETSGFGALIESPSDVSDFIKGVFGLSSVLVILREKSIWLATKQASATEPFNAYPSVPGIGCDSPYSVQVTKYGLAWLDRRSRTVWSYTPGDQPVPIGRPVEKSILANITDPDIIFSGYDPIEDAYSVSIPAVGSMIVPTWTYYFKEEAWTYNEYVNITSYDNVELLTATVSIDDLVGSMDGLVGSFDSLSPVLAGEERRIFGFVAGELATPEPLEDIDWNSTVNSEMNSKTFVVPASDIYVAVIVVEYILTRFGQMGIWYAPDGGVNQSSFIFGESYTPDPTTFGKPQIAVFRKVVHSRRYAFSIRATSGDWQILGYEVWVTTAGEISQVRQVK